MSTDDREAREMLGDHATPEQIDAVVLSLIFQRHYIEPDPHSVDNGSRCVCGEWYEGEMEPGWDDHLGEVAVAAGFSRQAPPEVTDTLVDDVYALFVTAPVGMTGREAMRAALTAALGGTLRRNARGTGRNR